MRHEKRKICCFSENSPSFFFSIHCYQKAANVCGYYRDFLFYFVYGEIFMKKKKNIKKRKSYWGRYFFKIKYIKQQIESLVGGWEEKKNFRKNLLQVDESESKFDILKNVFIFYKKKKKL